MNLKKMIEWAVVLDLETTIMTLPNGNHSPAPWYGNRVVAMGAMTNIFKDHPETVWRHIEDTQVPTVNTHLINILDIGRRQYSEVGGGLYVGHNIKFDLGHAIYAGRRAGWNEDELVKILSCVHVWDTMLAEYYLSNQATRSPSLEKCCEIHGIKFEKDVTVSESFKLGIGADRIDRVTLMKYLEADVRTTADLFKAQLASALAIGGPAYVHYLIKLMGASVTTAQAECTGLLLNRKRFEDERELIEKQLETLEYTINSKLAKVFDPRSKLDPSVSSPLMLKTYLFGGDYEIVENTEVLDSDGNKSIYKSGSRRGEVKTKKTTTKLRLDGLVPQHIRNHKYLKGKKLGTSSKVLQDLLLVLNEKPSTTWSGINVIITEILEYRRLAKDFNTYFGTLEEHLTDDGTLHATYNHSIAVTKRLTSSNPNFQNMSNKSGATDGD